MQDAAHLLKQMENLIKEYGGNDPGLAFLAPTIALVSARKTCLEHIVAEPTDTESQDQLRNKLQDYIAKFEQADLQAGLNASGSSASSAATAVANTPPIQKFRNLELLLDMKEQGLKAFDKCQSESDVKNANKELAVPKSALQDVLSTCKACFPHADVPNNFLSSCSYRCRLRTRGNRGPFVV
jgi:hypothetical protein